MSELYFNAQDASNLRSDIIALKNTIPNMPDITGALEKFCLYSEINAFLGYLSFTNLTNRQKEEEFRTRYAEVFGMDEEFVRKIMKAGQCYSSEFTATTSTKLGR